MECLLFKGTLSKINNMGDNCRTCLCYFNENKGKYSLLTCPAITSSPKRLELIKNIMTTCSLTLFSHEKNEVSKTFICMSCVDEINAMLTFLEKCIWSEAILKQVAELKNGNALLWKEDFSEKKKILFQPEVEMEIIVEKFNDDSTNENKKFVKFDSDGVPLSFINESYKNNNEEPKHECQDCHKLFHSALSLTFHKYKHMGCKPHTCITCNETFRSFQLIKKHMAEEHKSRYQPYLCRQCPEMFATKHHLARHEHRSHNIKMYSCSSCKRTFSTVSSLKFHENIHLGLLPYCCKLCTKSFSSASVLRDHKRHGHSELKKFDCHCGKSFKRKKRLEFHIDKVHEKKEKLRKYPCSECDKKFHHPYALKNHINSHLGVKPFLCNVCGAAFTALSNLTSHSRRVHSGDKPPPSKTYLCHNCGESFARASHLKRHHLRKHVPNAEKKHECPVCKKKFLEKSDVTGHIKLHNDLKPFMCNQCSKGFRTSWRLQAHVNRVHLGLRPFECPTCSVRFKTKSHLEKHIRTHTGEKPYPCPHCTYACAEKSNLKKHINIHLKTM